MQSLRRLGLVNYDIHNRSDIGRKKEQRIRVRYIIYIKNTYLKLTDCPDSISFNVKASIECTPGDTARNSILTD